MMLNHISRVENNRSCQLFAEFYLQEPDSFDTYTVEILIIFTDFF